MITTFLRRSVLDASRRNLPASLTSINTVLFHHLTPAAATVSDLTAIGPTDVTLPPARNPFGVKAKGFHFQSGPSKFRASMVSPAGFAISESSDREIGDSESVGDGLAISELGISPEVVKALSSKGIENHFPIQVGDSDQKLADGRASVNGPLVTKESTSKIKGTKICIAIRSFDNPEKQAWCLPPHSRKVAMPDTRVLYTVLRSPHVDKKSREQFEMRFKKRFLVIKAQSHELSKKLFWLKRYRILGAQYELQFHCKTRLDMTPVLGNING